MNGWRKVVGGLLTGILLLMFGLFAAQWSSFAADEDVEANEEAIVAQEGKCASRHKEVTVGLNDIQGKLGSIDTALKILVEGYKESK